MVIKKVFGQSVACDAADHTIVSSTKSMTGHLLGAAGGVETAITALALKAQMFPPTINLDDPDDSCDLDYIAGTARRKQVMHALSNSFGFGGGSAVLALRTSTD